jgi:hypothetical protein
LLVDHCASQGDCNTGLGYTALILARTKAGETDVKGSAGLSGDYVGCVMGGKRPANEYAFAPMYRRRRIRKRRVASSSYGIYPPYA